MSLNSYEIRLTSNAIGHYHTLHAIGRNPMEATETAVYMSGITISRSEPVFVVAINSETGLSFKFEMAQAT